MCMIYLTEYYSAHWRGLCALARDVLWNLDDKHEDAHYAVRLPFLGDN